MQNIESMIKGIQELKDQVSILSSQKATTSHFKSCYEVWQSGKTLPGTFSLQIDEDIQTEAYCLENGYTVMQWHNSLGLQSL